MNVKEAEAQLVEAKAGAAHRAAKEAYREDPTKGNKTKKRKTALTLEHARQDWRDNYRKAPDGPGDGTAAPDAHTVGTTVTGGDEDADE